MDLKNEENKAEMIINKEWVIFIHVLLFVLYDILCLIVIYIYQNDYEQQ